LGIHTKTKKLERCDPEEYGDVYSLTATKSDTRLFLCHHEGSRNSEDAMVEQMRSKSSLTPVFTSDDWDSFEEGLLNIMELLKFLHTKV